MHCDNLEPTRFIVDPTSETGQPLTLLPSVSPSLSLSSEPTLTHKPPHIQPSLTAFQKSGKISLVHLHMGMIGKQEQNIPSSVTISPVVQEQAGPIDDVDGISLRTLGKSMPLPRPTRENVLRRLSEALMRRSLTKVCCCVFFRYSPCDFDWLMSW